MWNRCTSHRGLPERFYCLFIAVFLACLRSQHTGWISGRDGHIYMDNLCTATLRWKLQIKHAMSAVHSILMLGQPGWTWPYNARCLAGQSLEHTQPRRQGMIPGSPDMYSIDARRLGFGEGSKEQSLIQVNLSKGHSSKLSSFLVLLAYVKCVSAFRADALTPGQRVGLSFCWRKQCFVFLTTARLASHA